MTRDKAIEAADEFQKRYFTPKDEMWLHIASARMADFHLSERSKLLAEIRARVEGTVFRQEILDILDEYSTGA